MTETSSTASDVYHPAGRLVSLLSPDNDIPSLHDLALKLGRKAASLGETVLMLDACDGELMRAADIIYNRTLAHIVFEGAPLHDALYVTSNEHFTATAIGEMALDEALGSLAALSLSYDWVFVVPPEGCTPVHIRLAGASDVSVLSYDTKSDKFMRAYWMLDAIRRRKPKFDPLVVSTGDMSEAVETALMLSETVRDHLGAPPPYAGHIEDLHLETRLLSQMREMFARKTGYQTRKASKSSRDNFAAAK